MTTTSQFMITVTSSAINKIIRNFESTIRDCRHFQRLGNCVAQIDWAILLLMLLLPPNPKIAWPSYENQPSFIYFTDSIGNNLRIVLLFPFTIQILPCARFLHAGCVWPLTRLMTQKILYKIRITCHQTNGSNVCSIYWLVVQRYSFITWIRTRQKKVVWSQKWVCNIS